MNKTVRTVIVILLAVVTLATGGLGCGGNLLSGTPDDLDAFVTDRVVEVRLVMKDEDWEYCQANALAEEYVRADFWFDGELVPDIAVRPKGNSSLRSTVNSGTPRFSLKVDFNLFNAARNFRGLKKLNFNNGFKDPTLIREKLAYELFEYMGMPTPRTSFVDLWINDTHLGIYTQTEQIDQTFLNRHFTYTTGNLYKPAGRAALLGWTEADLSEQQAITGTNERDDPIDSQQINLGGGRLSDILNALDQDRTDSETAGIPNIAPGMPPNPGMGLRPTPGLMPGRQQLDFIEAMALKTNENNPDHSALFRFLDVLNNEPDETFAEEIEKVLDVDQVLRFLAVSALTVHLDNYLGSGHNYYLYEVNGRFTVLPWDMNEAFGTFSLNIGHEGIINFLIDEPTAGPVADYPLAHRLLSHQPYLDTYHGYLEALLDGPFSVEAMHSRIDELTDMIRPYVADDELKFYSTADFERGLTGGVTEPANIRQGFRPQPGLSVSDIGLKDFVTERGISVREQLDGKRPSTANGNGNGGDAGMFIGLDRRDKKPPAAPSGR